MSFRDYISFICWNWIVSEIYWRLFLFLMVLFSYRSRIIMSFSNVSLFWVYFTFWCWLSPWLILRRRLVLILLLLSDIDDNIVINSSSFFFNSLILWLSLLFLLILHNSLLVYQFVKVSLLPRWHLIHRFVYSFRRSNSLSLWISTWIRVYLLIVRVLVDSARVISVNHPWVILIRIILALSWSFNIGLI